MGSYGSCAVFVCLMSTHEAVLLRKVTGCVGCRIGCGWTRKYKHSLQLIARLQPTNIARHISKHSAPFNKKKTVQTRQTSRYKGIPTTPSGCCCSDGQELWTPIEGLTFQLMHYTVVVATWRQLNTEMTNQKQSVDNTAGLSRYTESRR